MSQVGILLKNNFNMLVGSLRRRRKMSERGAIYFLVFGVGLIVYLYTMQAISMFDGLGKIGLEKLCVFHALITTVAVLTILGMMRTATNPKTSDSDFLLSMPMKRSTIVFSKTVNRWLFDFFFVALMFVPYIVIYEMRVGVSAPEIARASLLALVLPTLSVGISYTFDFIVNRLFNKTKMASLFKSLMLTSLFIVVLGSMLLKTSLYGTVKENTMLAYFSDRPIEEAMLGFLFSPTVKNVCIALGTCLLPFALGFCLFSLNFGKTFVGYHSKNTELKFGETRSPFGLLFKKELYNYASTTAYVVNTIIGPVMALCVGVFALTMGQSGLEKTFGGASIPKELIFGICALVLCGASATAFISAPSISLEGQNMWLIKSAPIDEKSVLLSKFLTHLVIVVPSMILSGLMVSVAFRLGAVAAIELILLSCLFTVIVDAFGLFANLLHPRFDWENETQVIKQSMSSFLTMIFGLLLTALLFGIYKLFSSLTMLSIGWICVGVYAGISALLCTLLFTVGAKLFRKIEI